MRFLYTALALVALASTQINAKMLVASVGPITEDPVPKWAKSSDLCSTVGSCDSCQPEGNQYCFYKESGDATCCQGEAPASSSSSSSSSSSNNDDSESLVGLVASVGPITEDPVPKWATPSDSCSTVGSCDSCQPGGNQYCYYKESGDATCCQGNAPAAVEEPKTFVAGVGPITEDPVPKWASSDDTCGVVGSCDSCQPSSTQYCYYKDSGDATCCQGKGDMMGSNDGDNNRSSMSASVGPIEEDPIPSWASSSDVCQRKRSCDVCQTSETTYCKYTDSGIPQCCTGNNSATVSSDLDAEAVQL